MANCSESFPYTSILFPEIEDDAFFIVSAVIGGIFLVLNLLNFAEELWFLCRYNSNAPARNYTTYILILFPMSTSNPGTYFQFINIASLLLSMWAAIVLTKAVECKLPNRRIRAKFLSVQLTMVFSDAQRSILTILASSDVIDCVGTRGPMVQAYRYHYALLVLETFLLSLLARYAYRFQDPPYQYERMARICQEDINK
uniref:Organic solute transporter subunit alpha n=1 Tax=Magallana gigas TaxID=29159 RepID=K1QKQ1_MAGGI